MLPAPAKQDPGWLAANARRRQVLNLGYITLFFLFFKLQQKIKLNY
jgi:hypothetical protein